MADPVYTLGFVPEWYLVDNAGHPLGAGYINFYSSLNPSSRKAVYTDATGAFAYPNPVLINENGTAGPFYFEFDEDDPDDLYFIEVTDSDGTVIWTINNYSPQSGGGSVVTTAKDLENQVINGTFWRNIGSVSSPLPAWAMLCPGAHDGFADTSANHASPDIVLYKSNTTSTDSLTFTKFSPLGTTPFSTEDDVTPEFYLNYTCTVAGSGETFKVVQYPVCAHVQNLSNQEVTVTLWARRNSGSGNINLYFRQFYGDGTGASVQQQVLIGSCALTTDWVKYEFQTTVPNAAGQTLGACGNDGLFIWVDLPHDAICSVDHTKLCMFLGVISPDNVFENYDQIGAVIDSPRTGDIRTSINAFQPYGWAPANDGTIGSASSSATPRANQDTFPLYNLIWNSLTDTYAPVTTGRGATAQADFSANKSMRLTRALGRVVSGMNVGMTASFTVSSVDTGADTITVSSTTTILTGTPVYLLSSGTVPGGLTSAVVYYAIVASATTLKLALSEDYAIAGTPVVDLTSAGTGTITLYPALGATAGQGVHVLTSAELPNPLTTGATFIGAPAGSANNVIVNSGAGGAGAVANSGGGSAHNTMQPTAFYNVFFKL